MNEENSRGRKAVNLRRLDIGAGSKAQELRAHVIGNGDPVEQRIADEQHGEGASDRGTDEDHHVEKRQGAPDFGEPLADEIGESAEIPFYRSHHRPEEHSRKRQGKTEKKRDSEPVNNARVHIATAGVESEGMSRHRTERKRHILRRQTPLDHRRRILRLEKHAAIVLAIFDVHLVTGRSGNLALRGNLDQIEKFLRTFVIGHLSVVGQVETRRLDVVDVLDLNFTIRLELLHIDYRARIARTDKIGAKRKDEDRPQRQQRPPGAPDSPERLKALDGERRENHFLAKSIRGSMMM